MEYIITAAVWQEHLAAARIRYENERRPRPARLAIDGAAYRRRRRARMRKSGR